MSTTYLTVLLTTQTCTVFDSLFERRKQGSVIRQFTRQAGSSILFQLPDNILVRRMWVCKRSRFSWRLLKISLQQNHNTVAHNSGETCILSNNPILLEESQSSIYQKWYLTVRHLLFGFVFSISVLHWRVNLHRVSVCIWSIWNTQYVVCFTTFINRIKLPKWRHTVWRRIIADTVHLRIFILSNTTT